jgi:hypothetical protein
MNGLDGYVHVSFITQTPITIDCSSLTYIVREEQRKQYPRLPKMYIILSIPAMFAKPERVYPVQYHHDRVDVSLGSHIIERKEYMQN